MNIQLIKESNKISIDFHKIQDKYNYKLLNNILSALGRYNYTLSLESIDIFSRLDWDYRVTLLGELNKILYGESKENNGSLDKFYINYPNTVNSQDKRELYINSLLYYYYNFWKADAENNFMDKPTLSSEIPLIEIEFIDNQGGFQDSSKKQNSNENNEESQNEDSQMERALEGGRFISNIISNEELEKNKDLNYENNGEFLNNDEDSEENLDIDSDEEDLEESIDDELDENIDDELDEDSDEDIDDELDEDSDEDLDNNSENNDIFHNPYKDDDSDLEEEESFNKEKKLKSLYKSKKIVYNGPSSQINYSNGRQIDDLINRRQYLDLLKLLKKEPNELARKLVFILEGIFYKLENKNDRVINLSKILGVFEGISSAIACDTLKSLQKEIKYKISYFNINEELLKIYKDLYLIVIEEISDRE